MYSCLYFYCVNGFLCLKNVLAVKNVLALKNLEKKAMIVSNYVVSH